MVNILKRVSLLVVMVVFIMGPAHLLMAQPAPSSVRHSESELCDDCIWEKVATCGGFLEGPSFDRSGQLWMVNSISGNIVKVEKDKCVTVGKTPGPNGSKFHKDGRLFITDRVEGLISFDTKTGRYTTIASGFDGKPFKGTNDLVFDANGGLYFTDPGRSNALDRSGRVFYLPPGPDAEPQLFLSNIAYPNGIALSPDGQHLYVAEFLLNRIIFSPVVNPKNKLEAPSLFANMVGVIGPDGLAVDSEGNVYTAHMGSGEIAAYDPQGFLIGTIRLPKDTGPLATNLAFRGQYLYVTEALVNDVVWRIRLKKNGLPLYGDRW